MGPRLSAFLGVLLSPFKNVNLFDSTADFQFVAPCFSLLSLARGWQTLSPPLIKLLLYESLCIPPSWTPAFLLSWLSLRVDALSFICKSLKMLPRIFFYPAFIKTKYERILSKLWHLTQPPIFLKIIHCLLSSSFAISLIVFLYKQCIFFWSGWF